MVLDIILIIGILILGFLFYRQDVVIKKQIDYIESIERKMVDNYSKITNALATMKTVDSKGGFESDDEVGAIFKELKKIINELEKELNGE